MQRGRATFSSAAVRESFFDVHVGWNACHTVAAAYTVLYRNKNVNKYVAHVKFYRNIFCTCCSGN